MRAMIVKELRENLKWALLLALAAGAALAWCIATQSMGRVGGPLLFYVAMPLIAPAVGLLLGLLQSLPVSARAGQWELLLHRPVKALRIFWAHVLAGLLLYMLGAAVPLGLAWSWLAMPDHSGMPLHWRMALPNCADLLVGVAYYFAALLIGVRKARWHGTRVLSLGLPILASIGVVGAPELWQALLAAGVGVIVAVAAARGAFLAGGHDASQSRLGRLALGATLASGLFFVGCVGVAVVSDLARPSWSDGYVRAFVAADRNGHLLRIRQQGDLPQTVTDLSGHPVEPYSTLPRPEQERALSRDLIGGVGLGLASSNQPQSEHEGYRSPSRVTPWQCLGWNTTWFYSAREGLLLGYDIEHLRYIGAIGPDGFAARGQPLPRQFDGPPVSLADDGRLLAVRDEVYRLNLDTRDIRPFFRPRAGDEVIAVKDRRPQDTDNAEPFVAIATRQRVYVLSPSGRVLIETNLAYPPGQWDSLTVDKVPGQDRYFMMYRLPRALAWPEVKVMIAEVAGPAPGAVVATHESSWEFRTPPPPRWHQMAGAITPPALIPLAGGVFWLIGKPLHDSDPGAPRFILFGILMAAGALVSAGVVYALARRCALTTGQRIAWVIAGLALGLMAILLFLGLEVVPARVRCGACGRKRVVNRERCEHCAAPMPAPPEAGTEIFAESESRQPAGAT